MIHVLVHLHNPGSLNYQNQGHSLPQVPQVGEYVALGTDNTDWFRVELVVHCAFEATYRAEIYAVCVNALEAMRQNMDNGTAP